MAPKLKKTKDKEKLFEGSNKIIYYDNENNEIILFFKDELKNDDGVTIHISGKGVVNNTISAAIMSHLNMVGINNHFINKLNMREQIIELVEAIPIVLSVSNIASGRYIDALGFEPGYVFNKPMLDFRLKTAQKTSDPILNESQLLTLNIINKEEIEAIKALAFRVNDFLSGLFAGINLRLIQCNLEFGRAYDIDDNALMLIDEISPDTCKLSDIETNKRFDYEEILANPTQAMNIYQEIAKRLGSVNIFS